MSKVEGEKDWECLQRQVPWAYEAFGRIPRKNDAMEALFDKPITIWDGDSQADLTNKTLLGLLQLEIEELTKRVEGIEESMEGLSPRKGWRLLLRAKDKILYQSPTGEVAEIPVDLADAIVGGRPFEGEVTVLGKHLRFCVGEDILADIPRSLVLELRGYRPETNEGDGGGGGGRGEPDRRE